MILVGLSLTPPSAASAPFGADWAGTVAQAVPAFADVPLDFPYHEYIDAIYRAGLIPACSEALLCHCPGDPSTLRLAAYRMVRAKGLKWPRVAGTAPAYDRCLHRVDRGVGPVRLDRDVSARTKVLCFGGPMYRVLGIGRRI